MPEIFGEQIDFDSMSDDELREYLTKLQAETAKKAPKKREPKEPAKPKREIKRIEL